MPPPENTGSLLPATVKTNHDTSRSEDTTKATPQASTGSFQYKIIESAIRTCVGDLSRNLMAEVSEMRVEMMRQFYLQRVSLSYVHVTLHPHKGGYGGHA